MNDEFVVNSIIGDGASFNGEFNLSGLLRIDGHFRGKININGKLLIGKSGVIETDIIADTVVSGGMITGNIYAKERVILLEKSKMKGDIVTPRLIIEDGVLFEGKCTINPV